MASLEEIAKRISNCKACPLHRYRKHAVSGEGPSDAAIFFVGEAPGRLEDKTGRPFVGPSGKFLEKLLNSLGLKRNEVFLTGIVKCRPPNNRKPKKSEVETCKHYTLEQIETVNPSLIVILGSTALNGLLGLDKVSKLHGKVLEKGKKRYFITFHPSAARRFPRIRELMISDFKKLKKLITKEKI